MEATLLSRKGSSPTTTTTTNGLRLLDLRDEGKNELRRDVTTLSIDQTGFQAFLPECMQVAFADREVEALYRRYYEKEKQADVQCFAAMAVFCATFSLAVQAFQPNELRTAKTIALATAAAAHAAALLLCRFRLVPSALVAPLPPILALVLLVQILCDALLNSILPTSGDVLPWLLLLTFMIYALLPLRMRYCAVLNVLTLGGLVGVTLYLVPASDDPGLQVAANVLLLLGANLLGCFSYFFADKRQRKAFLEARQTLEVKLVIEEQAQEQERLLLSVLPQHVAAEIRRDLGAVVNGQFKKIYMSRHENVSILFADIVGFTAISSTYPAAELVRILNELFALFDQLSEKFHQLRIKILGDCYYCISGAPQERKDHAVLCVHMGLSMVEAIKYVREKTKSPVDMRVGIHTGGVLAGVLGQRQWQFDVYSKDVELANKMESGGLPGRVHISEKTLQYLNDEFQVEVGDGASRDEAIKLSGLKTFLIVKVLKPYPEGTLDYKEDRKWPDMNETKENKFREEKQACMINAEVPSPEEDYRKRLYKELTGIGERRTIPNTASLVTLSFRNPQLEGDYQRHNANESGLAIISCPIVLVFSSFAQFCILPRSPSSIVTFAFGFLFLTTMALMSSSPSAPHAFPRAITKGGQIINNNVIKRHLWASIAIILLGSTNILDIYFCEDMSFFTALNGSFVDPQIGCIFPQYFSNFATLTAIAVSLLTHISYIVQFILMVLLLAIHCYLNIDHLSGSFEVSDDLTYGTNSSRMVPRKYILSGLLATLTIGLTIINRQSEVTARQLFLWRQELEEQKERAAGMRQKNEALVYNILPPHVARHFLSSRKNDEELYGHSYPRVGVLFASMPNFSDFYTEESVNNQGLECLRFLNEVISDFDALLEDPRFHDVIKIKTIGSTYMAASGLNTEEKHSPEDPIQVQWAHLARITEFALALKDTLHGINEESFNNFILRMGINHGPIIAGVIGARKPHYDMWGNTVNVASRMESTGKAGYIQVVEETATILREFGYEFEQRGLVSVKGKGKLMTYYLIGKTKDGQPSQASPTPSMPTE